MLKASSYKLWFLLGAEPPALCYTGKEVELDHTKAENSHVICQGPCKLVRGRICGLQQKVSTCWLEIFCDLVEFGQFQKQLKQMWRGIFITNLSSSVQGVQSSAEVGRAWG